MIGECNEIQTFQKIKYRIVRNYFFFVISDSHELLSYQNLVKFLKHYEIHNLVDSGMHDMRGKLLKFLKNVFKNYFFSCHNSDFVENYTTIKNSEFFCNKTVESICDDFLKGIRVDRILFMSTRQKKIKKLLQNSIWKITTVFLRI